MIFYAKNSAEFHALILENKIVLVDFYADWCEPCKWLDKILGELVSEKPEQFIIIKVDVDLLPEFKSEFSIQSVPVLMLFKNGTNVWRLNGFMFSSDLLKTIAQFSD
jgi:thioredoxin 1